MKKFFLSLLLLVTVFNLSYSQDSTRIRPNGVIFIGEVDIAATTIGDHRIRTTFQDLRGNYTTSDVALGDEIWDPKCDRYRVVVIHSTSPFLEVEVDRLNTGSGAPQQGGGNGFIFSPTTTYDYPYDIEGISEKMKACIQAHRSIEIDEDINNAGGSGGGGKTFYSQDSTLTGNRTVTGASNAHIFWTAIDQTLTGDSLFVDVDDFIKLDAADIYLDVPATTGEIFFNTPRIKAATASVGLFWGLIDPATGEGEWDAVTKYLPDDFGQDTTYVIQQGSVDTIYNLDTINAALNLYEYNSDSMRVRSHGLGVTYSLTSNTGTVTIPEGTFVDFLYINSSYATLGNSETMFIEIVDGNGGNTGLYDLMYADIHVWERDIFGTLPDGSGSGFNKEAGSMALASRTAIDIYDVDTGTNTITYRLQSLGNGSEFTIKLSSF